MTTTKKKKTTKKKRKLTGHQFQKGNKESVGIGRPKMTEEQRAFSLKTRTQFKLLLSKYSSLTLKEIEKEIEKKTLPVLDIAVLRHLKEMATSGSMDRVDWTANHILGKEKETTNINLTGGLENTDMIDVKKLSKEELLALKEISEKSKK